MIPIVNGTSHSKPLCHSQQRMAIIIPMYHRQASRATDISLQKLNPFEEGLAQGIVEHNEKLVKRNQLEQDYLTAYKPANYNKALNYKRNHSYQHKEINGTHTTISFFEDNKTFQRFGPGIYLYLELFRRLGWLFFFLAILECYIVVLNWSGSGLKEYSISFGNMFIYSTLGNSNRDVTGYDAYMQTAAHCAVNLFFFIFFIFWKVHKINTVDEYENGDDIIHPRRFCVEVEGLPTKGVSNRDLEAFFSKFGPVYECSLVYNYKDKLRFFQDVDEIDQKIKEEELEITIGSGSMSSLQKLKNEKEELSNKIHSTKISPRILFAFVHFQFQKSKADMLDRYNLHNMFSTTFHECCMHTCCCCCFDEMPEQFRFQGTALKIRSAMVTDPEQINWESFDITICSKFFRVLLAIIIILIFLFICSTLVALCSIFITTNTVDCTGLGSISKQVAEASTDPRVKTCFCNSALFDIFNQDVQSLCRDIFKTLYIENLLQVVASIVSTITNFIFGLLLTKIIEFTKPKNQSSSLVTQSFVFFLFLFINSIALPLLIYSDLNGVKPASFVSLIKVLFPNVEIFNMDSFKYYNDYTTLWYKNVSPYFTNFLIVDLLMVWIKFIWDLCFTSCSYKSLESDEGKILQKKMNEKISSFQVDAVKETSYVFLIVFMVLMQCGGIPILMPLGALCIISRYITNKHMLIHHSKRIEGLTEDFNALSVVILPFAAVFGCFFGIWMLTGSTMIYPGKLNVQIPGTEQIQNSTQVLPRVFYVSFTFIMGALVVLYIFFYNIIVRFLSWACTCCCSYETKVQPVTRRAVRFSDATRTMNTLYSYNIHHNDNYKNAILNLERFLEIE